MNLVFALVFAVCVVSACGTPKPPPTTTTPAPDPSGCNGDGWTSVGDDKCFKLLTEWKRYEQAKAACRDEKLSSESFPPTLATIKSAEEQGFVNQYIFGSSSVQSNVWIGARRIENSNKFQWVDGSLVEDYTNWAPNSPSDEQLKECVVLQSKYTRGLNGQWRDVGCGSPNYVLCQKTQSWNFDKLKEEFLASKSKYDREIKKLKSENAQLQHETQQLQHESQQLQTKTAILTIEVANIVPIGFIYVQLPVEKSPLEIWPRFTWTDVSATYAGVFFRVQGGGSAGFGSIQEDNAPRIVEVRTGWRDVLQINVNDYCHFNGTAGCYIGIPKGGNSIWTMTGEAYYGNARMTRFTTSGGEVRPRNMAVRVWKRSG